jgi:hypothetical protein
VFEDTLATVHDVPVSEVHTFAPKVSDPVPIMTSVQFNPEEVMQFQVTEIEFDFDDEDEMIAYDADRLVCETIGQIWDADDEDDLIEEITCASGWCIKSIDYRIILN